MIRILCISTLNPQEVPASRIGLFMGCLLLHYILGSSPPIFLHFRSPVYVGEEIVGKVQAINIRENKKRYMVKFSTKCVKNNCELIVLDGEAMAILPTLAMEQVPSTSTADGIEY
ncbi:hypothetical protein ACOSQ2_033116 [Xanthoceras sorbifolium]